MVTFSLIVSRESDRSAPYSRLPASSQGTKSPVVHLLSIQLLTKCSSRNSFVLKTIHFDGGGPLHLLPGKSSPLSSLRILRPICLSLFSLHLRIPVRMSASISCLTPHRS